jgi:hypothetical protein
MAEYVGEILETDLYVAIAVDSKGDVLAYVCNGMGIDYLFRGSVQANAVDLTSEAGQASLQASMDGEGFTGTFSVEGKTGGVAVCKHVVRLAHPLPRLRIPADHRTVERYRRVNVLRQVLVPHETPANVSHSASSDRGKDSPSLRSRCRLSGELPVTR